MGKVAVGNQNWSYPKFKDKLYSCNKLSKSQFPCMPVELKLKCQHQR